jgi:AraC-like DNA-binding protein
MFALPTRQPTTRIDLPSAQAARFVMAFVERDTSDCQLQGEHQLNRFPAASYCVITWFLSGSARLLSCGGQEMDEPLPACAISGCQSSPLTSRNCGDVHALMVVFYPDAFHALFGIDLALLQNRFVDARQVLPAEAMELVEAVSGAGSADARRALVEQFLLARVKSVRVPPFTRILRMGNRITLGLVSAMLGIGPRQLQRLASRQMGLNLRTHLRLVRGERSFLSAQRQHLAGEHLDLAGHALASDYADQSHMGRECKAQTGRSPAQLARDVPTQEADWFYRVEFPNDEDRTPARSA